MGLVGIEPDHVTRVPAKVTPRTETQLRHGRDPDPRIRTLAKLGMNHSRFAVHDVAEGTARPQAPGRRALTAVMASHARKPVCIDGPAGATVGRAEGHG